MTPEMMVQEILSRWENVRAELVQCKRLDPEVYDEVVSSLTRIKLLEYEDKGFQE